MLVKEKAVSRSPGGREAPHLLQLVLVVADYLQISAIYPSAGLRACWRIQRAAFAKILSYPLEFAHTAVWAARRDGADRNCEIFLTNCSLQSNDSEEATWVPT